MHRGIFSSRYVVAIGPKNSQHGSILQRLETMAKITYLKKSFYLVDWIFCLWLVAHQRGGGGTRSRRATSSKHRWQCAPCCSPSFQCGSMIILMRYFLFPFTPLLYGYLAFYLLLYYIVNKWATNWQEWRKLLMHNKVNTATKSWFTCCDYWFLKMEQALVGMVVANLLQQRHDCHICGMLFHQKSILIQHVSMELWNINKPFLSASVR